MTNVHGATNGNRRRWIPFLGAAAALVFAALLRFALRPAHPVDQGTYYTVVEGPLTISVTESGTVKPREQEIIKNELEGRTTILYLIPEGTRVNKGDLLVELDASALQDSRLNQEIRVLNAEASFIQSRENLEIVKNQAQSDVDRAELDLRFAREDLVQYREGEYPNALKAREALITLAQEELRRAEEKLKWSRVLFEEQYIAESELQADELQVRKAQLDVELALNERELLTVFVYPRRVAQLESDAKQAEMALERIRRRASASVVQAEAELRARESEFMRESDKLEKLTEQIARARIVAPRDGLVIYATSTQFSWRGTTEPLAEGQEVRERQELIHLPTASTFMAEVRIHESSLDRIRVGLPVRVTVAALPGQEFGGRVRTIAPLPDPSSVFMNPDLKVYKTDVDIEGGGDVLRAGMSCDVEIVVERYAAALFVPVQCVLRVDGRPSVFVLVEGRRALRPVTLGLDNNRMVRVLDGLQPGDRVLLTPPLDLAEAVRDANGNGEERFHALPATAGDRNGNGPPQREGAPASGPERAGRTRPGPETSPDRAPARERRSGGGQRPQQP